MTHAQLEYNDKQAAEIQSTIDVLQQQQSDQLDSASSQQVSSVLQQHPLMGPIWTDANGQPLV